MLVTYGGIAPVADAANPAHFSVEINTPRLQWPEPPATRYGKSRGIVARPVLHPICAPSIYSPTARRLAFS